MRAGAKFLHVRRVVIGETSVNVLPVMRGFAPEETE
jgi:hypothetical protein